MPQQVYLFNGTLRDNLLVADGGADDTRIARACDRAGLGPFVRSLPSGFDTLVGDDGLKLSGGERQRVAIARVFLKDAPILILDEATANLDAGDGVRGPRERPGLRSRQERARDLASTGGARARGSRDHADRAPPTRRAARGGR